MSFCAFQKAAPESLSLPKQLCPEQGRYKYLLRGKGCTLGILFQDSVNVYFEWLTEEGRPVAYGPEIRYKAWSRRVVARLIGMGVWEMVGTDDCRLAIADQR